jgi:hypothetical protein
VLTLEGVDVERGLPNFEGLGRLGRLSQQIKDVPCAVMFVLIESNHNCSPPEL